MSFTIQTFQHSSFQAVHLEIKGIEFLRLLQGRCKNGKHRFKIKPKTGYAAQYRSQLLKHFSIFTVTFHYVVLLKILVMMVPKHLELGGGRNKQLRKPQAINCSNIQAYKWEVGNLQGIGGSTNLSVDLSGLHLNLTHSRDSHPKLFFFQLFFKLKGPPSSQCSLVCKSRVRLIFVHLSIC